MTVAERAGFKGIIIVRNGIEGTIAFPLLRDVKLLLSARQKDGSFRRHEMIIENAPVVDTEEMIEKPKAPDNANLIETYLKAGASGNKHFDLRVKMTSEGLTPGFRVVEENISMKRISFYTFGCRLNQSETASIQNSFEQGGYQVVGFDEPSDIVVINTCTVTEGGDADTRHLVHKVNRLNPTARIALVGCQAQIQKEQLAHLPNVRWIVGNGRKMDLLSVFNEFPEPERAQVITPAIEREPFSLPIASVDPDHTRANIKIQDGCDFFCSFCEIPYARGRARSRVFEDIFIEASALVTAGHKELILTGINIGTYSYQDKTLMDVIKAMNALEGLERLRISSIEPTTISKDIFNYMGQGHKLCRYLHIPLQSGDDEILREMKRKYTVDEFSDFVRQAEAQVPHIWIGTDVIVGFPGET